MFMPFILTCVLRWKKAGTISWQGSAIELHAGIFYFETLANTVKVQGQAKLVIIF